MAAACTASLAVCADNSDGCLECVAVLLGHGAEANHKHLIYLARVFTLDELNTCFIGVLSSVDNPFIPGMTLSVAFDDAAPKASETEARTLWSLMETIDNVLLEASSVNSLCVWLIEGLCVCAFFVIGCSCGTTVRHDPVCPWDHFVVNEPVIIAPSMLSRWCTYRYTGNVYVPADNFSTRTMAPA